MKPVVIKIPHQGFCYGVKRSIDILNQALADLSLPRPFYLLGSIVHNQFVNQYFAEQGVIILPSENKSESLEQLSSGTVIITAHGISDLVRDKIVKRQLAIVDATCPYVAKTYEKMKMALKDSSLIFIGKDHHPETEAVKDLGSKVYLMNSLEVPMINDSNIAIGHQTTFSSFDVNEHLALINKKYQDAYLLDMLCHETQNRQDSLCQTLQAVTSDTRIITIIIGDPKSNNTNKLFELAKRNRGNPIFISSLDELENFNPLDYQIIVIGSGTSTPYKVVEEVFNYLTSDQPAISTLISSDYIN